MIELYRRKVNRIVYDDLWLRLRRVYLAIWWQSSQSCVVVGYVTAAIACCECFVRMCVDPVDSLNTYRIPTSQD